jgi:chromosome segregation ATPase
MLTVLGCGATRPAAAPGVEPLAVNTPRGLDFALRDARAESDGLRSALAAARISAAKQEAELQDLRRHVGELEQALLLKQRDLAALTQERDGMLHAKAEIASQAVQWVDVRPVASELPRPETVAMQRFSELEATVHALKTALEQLRQDVGKLQTRSMPKAKPKPMALVAP